MAPLKLADSLKVGAVFVIFVAALSGFWAPLYFVAMDKRRQKHLKPKNRTNLLEHPVFMATKSFSAGIIMGVAAMHLLPDGMDDLEAEADYPVAMAMMCLGVILTLCLEQTLSMFNSSGHHHHGGADHKHNHSLAARLSADIHESSMHSAASDISRILRLKEAVDDVIYHEHAHNHQLGADACDENCVMTHCQDTIFEGNEEDEENNFHDHDHIHQQSHGYQPASCSEDMDHDHSHGHDHDHNQQLEKSSSSHDHGHQHDHGHSNHHDHEHNHDHGHQQCTHTTSCNSSGLDMIYPFVKANEAVAASSAPFNATQPVYTRKSKAYSDALSKDYRGSVDLNVLRALQHKAFVKTVVLEISIAIHSIIVGFGFGLLTDELTLKVLIIALSFHQFFEGVSLGTTIAETALESKTKSIFSLVFSMTMPIGIAIGILTTESSSAGSRVQGYANALASGSLLYSSLVEMVAELFNSDSLRNAPLTRISMVLTFAIGCGLLALLAVWS